MTRISKQQQLQQDSEFWARVVDANTPKGVVSPDAIHAILTQEAARVDLPKFYTRDLTFHDLNDLHESGTQHFIYVLRECGTHIVRLDQGKQQYACVVAIAGMAHADAMHWYQFCDGRLEEISVEQAKWLANRWGR